MPLSRIVKLLASAAVLAAVVSLPATNSAAQRYYPGTASIPTAPSGGDDPGPVTPVHAVFLRAGPSVGSPVIGTLQPGMPLQVLASANDGWMEVSSPAGTGWTYSSYLGQAISAP
ncbi:MAG TPA: SH3 domain-containing protein [Stellaceae bacterium]|nr:SH3 domain-containing protein [Stellaceae bacterium]